jgi:hypothetical protein
MEIATYPSSDDQEWQSLFELAQYLPPVWEQQQPNQARKKGTSDQQAST